MGRVEGYRNFCNKIWNAANFVFENTEGKDTGVNGEPVELSSVDRWIISALQRTEAEVTRQLEAFRFDLAARALYEFIWDEYCARYLELVKPLLGTRPPASNASAAPGAPRYACWKPHCAWPTRSCRSSPRKSGSGSRRWPASPADADAAAPPEFNPERIDEAAEGDIESRAPSCSAFARSAAR